MVTKRSSLPQKVVGFYEAESGLAVGIVLKAKHEKPAKSFERFKNQTFFFLLMKMSFKLGAPRHSENDTIYNDTMPNG